LKIGYFFLKDLLAAVCKVKDEIGRTLLQGSQWASAHTHTRIPDPSGLMTGLDFA
jgi:hypothetical protein